MDYTGYEPGIFNQELYKSHGYRALIDLAKNGVNEVIWKYPCNLSVLRCSKGIIVHSIHGMELAERWYSTEISKDWRVVHQPLRAKNRDKSKAKEKLGLRGDIFLICSFGFLSQTKICDVILEGWLSSRLAKSDNCYLIFVGQSFDAELEKKLKERAQRAGVENRFKITGYIPRELYETYLEAADIAIQLRTKSRGETSRTVLDCLSYGIPTIVNSHGWMKELPDDVVVKLPEDVTPEDIAKTFENLYEDENLRENIGKKGQEYVRRFCDPRKVGEEYYKAIEFFSNNNNLCYQKLIINNNILNVSDICKPTIDDLKKVSYAIALNLGSEISNSKLFVDVSVLSKQDIGTGIQRVTRAILKKLVEIQPNRYRVEPVYSTPPVYRYARKFFEQYFGIRLGIPDDVIETKNGDIFLGLDLAAVEVPKCKHFFYELKARGVKIYFVVYDLLPVNHPEWFPPELFPIFSNWLKTITEVADGIVCISKSVADQLIHWLNKNAPERHKQLKIGYFHLGADVESAKSPLDRDVDQRIFDVLNQGKPIFLMVGTIEPRKGYDQALKAFERLWGEGLDITLVIVGKRGWMVEDIIRELENHPEKGRRLLWLEAVNDDCLLELYKKSTVLLMASRDEGFGLPLIEAARHGLPIIARDIPVFREICGNHAYYFSGDSPEDLAKAIKEWLKLYEKGEAPSVGGMKWQSWEESTKQLLDVILNESWYKLWYKGLN